MICQSSTLLEVCAIQYLVTALLESTVWHEKLKLNGNKILWFVSKSMD